MALLRALLMVLVTCATSLSAAAEGGHLTPDPLEQATHHHSAEDGADCCDHSTERGHSCHLLPAILAEMPLSDVAPFSGDANAIPAKLLLTGIAPAAPFDPPRAL